MLEPEEVKLVVNARIAMNLRDTKHPLHHKTVNGTIVDHDPTLEHLLSNEQLSFEDRQALLHKIDTLKPGPEVQIPKVVPVDRMFYGFDPYKG